jgi:FKBP-type peptidyl-prolyl cis-trans isomerase SlyD
MKIENEKVVTMHFTVMDKEKTVIDSTYDAEPLAFIQGSGLLVPALEEALFGLAASDKKSVSLTADQAYGERFEQLIQSMPKTMFEGMDVNVGMQFRATTDDGEQTVIVVDISDDKIVVDGNHPLAGIDLTFDVEVLEVREATTDELSHGHPHVEGESCGHSHH